MKKVLIFIALSLLIISPVLASEFKLSIITDETHTGAVLKLKSPSGELGDPIYPSLIGKGIGVVEFDVETGLSEANFYVRFVKNGAVTKSLENEEFYKINGTDIVIDLRENAKKIANSTLSVESAPIEEETAEAETEESIEEIPEKESFLSKTETITGAVVNGGKNIFEGPYGLLIQIITGVLVLGALLFFIVKKAYKSGAKAELKELGRMKLDEKIDMLD